MKRIVNLSLFLLLSAVSFGQTSYAFLPPPRAQFVDGNGAPLAGGFLYSYNAGTSTPLATYHLDTLGVISPNQNPIILDSTGSAEVRLLPQYYKFVLQDFNHVQVWAVDQVADLGQIALNSSVLLAPTGAALQTVIGPIAASYFKGNTAHTTSPGVRVGILDPASVLDTLANPPNLVSVSPAKAGQTDAIPDGGSFNSSFVLSPGPANWLSSTVYALSATILPYTNNPCDFSFVVSTAGTSAFTNPVFSTIPCVSSPATVNDGTVVWTSQGAYPNTNQLDCTAAGLTCKRTAFVYLEGAGCNNTTAAMGWDTFGANSPTPICSTGTNVQKGVLALPGAATRVQENTGIGAAATTCTTTYPNTTVAGNLLEVEIGVDGGKTVSSVTDGTNAYTRAVGVTNGNTDLEIWYYNNTSASKTAGSTLTVTLSAGANCVLNWKEYSGLVTGDAKDRTTSSTGTSTAPNSGSTAGTSQSVELVLAAVAAPSNPVISGQNGFVLHAGVQQATNIEIASEGVIQQASGAQSGGFTLSSSQAWASAIATFKVNVIGPVTAQRHIALPSYFLPASPINGYLKVSGQLAPVGTVNSVLGAQVICTADGSSDDPAFNAAVTSTVVIPQSYTLLTTPLLAIPSTGCASSNLLHFQIERLRYNASDTYEGYVFLTGATLQFGISQ